MILSQVDLVWCFDAVLCAAILPINDTADTMASKVNIVTSVQQIIMVE